GYCEESVQERGLLSRGSELMARVECQEILGEVCCQGVWLRRWSLMCLRKPRRGPEHQAQETETGESRPEPGPRPAAQPCGDVETKWERVPREHKRPLSCRGSPHSPGVP